MAGWIDREDGWIGMQNRWMDWSVEQTDGWTEWTVVWLMQLRDGQTVDGWIKRQEVFKKEGQGR